MTMIGTGRERKGPVAITRCAPRATPVARLAPAVLLALLLAGCATLRREVPAVISHAWERPEETALGRDYARQLSAYPGESGFYVLDDGREAFLARAALAATAERTLDLQYYYVGEDATADILLFRVLLAADRGVRVRLLVDDLYAARRDFDLAALTAHPNIEVRVFNPFFIRGPPGVPKLLEFLGNEERLDQRMHNKLWIADNAVAIVGGRNLADQYFAAGRSNNFADLDLLAAGPVVRELSRAFDDVWNSAEAVPAEAFLPEPPGKDALAKVRAALEADLERFRDSAYARAMREAVASGFLRARNFTLIPGVAEALWNRPDRAAAGNGPPPVSSVLLKVRALVESAQHEVIVISPYFIPNERGLALLGGLTHRGVRVQVLTNSLASTDVPVAYAAYARYRGRMLAAGVEIHELRPEPGVRPSGARRVGLSAASLHAKAIVVDRSAVAVGSMNFDPRSRLHNTEVAVLVWSPALGERLGALFDDAVLPANAYRVELTERGRADSPIVWVGAENGKEVRYDTAPLASFWRRAAASLFGAFVPEDLL
jgi:cardiolipin synthase C